MHTGLWGSPRVRDHLEGPGAGLDGKVILKWILKRWDWEAWTGLLWLRIWTGGGHL